MTMKMEWRKKRERKHNHWIIFQIFIQGPFYSDEICQLLRKYRLNEVWCDGFLLENLFLWNETRKSEKAFPLGHFFFCYYANWTGAYVKSSQFVCCLNRTCLDQTQNWSESNDLDFKWHMNTLEMNGSEAWRWIYVATISR